MKCPKCNGEMIKCDEECCGGEFYCRDCGEPKKEVVVISKKEYNDLLFRKKQIEQINKEANRLENAEIDGFDFGELVLNIL